MCNMHKYRSFCTSHSLFFQYVRNTLLINHTFTHLKLKGFRWLWHLIFFERTEGNTGTGLVRYGNISSLRQNIQNCVSWKSGRLYIIVKCKTKDKVLLLSFWNMWKHSALTLNFYLRKNRRWNTHTRARVFFR